ncbi:Na/Pi cotransporter family protein [Nitratireductor pacificus]|nr:Na/Pi cotransporter family protein [Nitratireductor pacificus]
MVLLQIVGSVALLLWGIRLVRTGIMRAFGATLRQHLGVAVNGRMSSFAVGMVVTIFLQSSTATALIVSSFAAKGLVTTAAALAVMLGADVGTSIAAQILSFNPTWMAYTAMLLGYVLHERSENYARRQIGRAVLGLGLVLISLSLIRASSEPLRESEVLTFIFAALDNEVLLTLFFAAILTWLAHSSVAMVLLIATMAASGVIPMGTGVIMVLGANIGGTVPPILATMRAGGQGQHSAIGNACFKLAASLVLLPFVPLVTDALQEHAGDPQIMLHVHTAFNVFVVLVFLPWVGPAARLLKRCIPLPAPTDSEPVTKYLDHELVGSPSLALTGATRELYRVNEYIEDMLALLTNGIESNIPPDPRPARENRARVSRIVEEIRLYLTKITREEISEADSAAAINLLLLSTNLSHVSDLIANAVESYAAPSEEKNRFSANGAEELLEMLELIRNGVRIALSASLQNDNRVRKGIQKQRKELERLVDKSRLAHFNRLEEREISSINTTSLHNELLRDFSRIYYHILTASKVGV